MAKLDNWKLVDRNWERKMFVWTLIGWVTLIGVPLIALVILLYILRKYG